MNIQRVVSVALAEDHEVGEIMSENGQDDVCDEEAGEINGDDEAEIKDVSTFKGEASDDKSMEFERELSQLDQNNSPKVSTTYSNVAERKS